MTNEKTDFYCSDHDRYFKNAQGLSAHNTKTHGGDGTALGIKAADQPAKKMYCKHIHCVPRFGTTSEPGLKRHNTYITKKAVAEGQHDLTVEEALSGDWKRLTPVVVEAPADITIDGLSELWQAAQKNQVLVEFLKDIAAAFAKIADKYEKRAKGLEYNERVARKARKG